MILFNIDFIGFSNSINILVLSSIVLLACLLTFDTYIRYRSVSFRSKLLLVGLRILSFSILGVLLLNPVFERTQFVQKKPLITVLIDNSASLGANSPSWDGFQSYSNLLAKVSQINTELYTPNYLFFDSSIQHSLNIDSIRLEGAQTDIYSAIRSVLSDYDSDEIILITDGISTKGRDPLFSAQDNRTPIHTIAVGDSTLKRDIILQNVDFPPNTLINTPYLLSATIRNVDLPGGLSIVRLFQNDSLIQSSPISFNKPNSTQLIEFLIEHKEAGLVNYSLAVDSVNGEWTTLNNKMSFDITAKDDQVNILYLSTELHPDIGAIRNLIQNMESYAMMTRTWIQGDQFVEGPLPTRRDTLDLIIIHGLNKELPNNLIEFFQETVFSVNTLFIHTPNTGSRHINSVYGSLNLFTISDGTTSNSLQLSPSPPSAGHVITDIPQINWSRTPFLKTNLNISNVSERFMVLFDATDRITQQHYPAIAISSLGTRRHSMLLFSGVSNLTLTSNKSEMESINSLINNVITWTSTSNTDDNFVISMSQNEFSSSEKIVLIARILNELGLPESEATISLDLESGSDVESRSFVFRSNNSGNYELEIPSLPVGNYKYEAIAEKSQQALGTQKGSFSVGNTQAELISTLRNDALLRTIAEFTQGNFIQFDKLFDINSLLTAKDPIIETKSEIFQLFRNPIWFYVITLLLGLEWFLRRRVLIP